MTNPAQQAKGVQNIPELLYVHTVAERLKCSVRMVYNLIREGDLEAVRLGKRGIRVSQASLAGYLSRQKIDPGEYYQ